MWHASAARLDRSPRERELRAAAFAALAGVGDRGREWVEWTGYGFHVRRRLTPDEQAAVGEAYDLRGTEEGFRRFAAVKRLIPPVALRLAEEELGVGVEP